MKIKESMGVYEAKTRLSEVIDYVSAGHSLIITKHGKPVARVEPVTDAPRTRKRGGARSEDFYMAEDFDAPLEDFAEYQ